MSLQVITIDGPVASGKSSVSRELANGLGWKWVSTGAFYRGLAYVAQATNADLTNETELSELAISNRWKVELAQDKTRVILDDQDVTDNIYREEVGTAASQLSLFPKVRESLLQAQRNLAGDSYWLVAEGRDCGTVVFPDAPVKFYLTARSEARAQRRAAEEGVSVEETQKAQQQRDKQDTTRKAAPLQIPESAHVIDTSTMDLNQVVNAVSELVKSEVNF